MKTYEFAKALNTFAKALRSLPNMEVNDFVGLVSSSNKEQTTAGNGEVAVNVATLASLSRIGKPQWGALIEQWDLPIKFSRKDSSRNVMDSVMRYLADNPGEIRRLQQVGAKSAAKASPELMKALSILMDTDNAKSETGD